MDENYKTFEEICTDLIPVCEDNYNINEFIIKLVKDPSESNLCAFSNLVHSFKISKQYFKNIDACSIFMELGELYYQKEEIQEAIIDFLLLLMEYNEWGKIWDICTILIDNTSFDPDNKPINTKICKLISNLYKKTDDFTKLEKYNDIIFNKNTKIQFSIRLYTIRLLYQKITFSPTMQQKTTYFMQSAINLIIKKVKTYEFIKETSKFISKFPQAIAHCSFNSIMTLFSLYKNDGCDLAIILGFIHPDIEIIDFQEHWPAEFGSYWLIINILSLQIDDEFCYNNQNNYENLLEIIKFKLIICKDTLTHQDYTFWVNYILRDIQNEYYVIKMEVLEILNIISNADIKFISIINLYYEDIIDIIFDFIGEENLSAFALLYNIMVHLTHNDNFNLNYILSVLDAYNIENIDLYIEYVSTDSNDDIEMLCSGILDMYNTLIEEI